MNDSLDNIGALYLEFNRRAIDAGMKLREASAATVGCSLKEEVWRQGKTVLYRYLPLPFTQAARTQPVLICFALVNRPYILDLQTDRSLVQRLLAAGLEVYLIDWGRPDDSDRDLELQDYIERYLGGCVHYVLQANGIEALNLIGVCQGGDAQPVLLRAASRADHEPGDHGDAGGFPHPGRPSLQVGATY